MKSLGYERPSRGINTQSEVHSRADDEYGYTVQPLINNFKQAAYTITMLYRTRWQIEILFRSIKRQLKIKIYRLVT